MFSPTPEATASHDPPFSWAEHSRQMLALDMSVRSVPFRSAPYIGPKDVLNGLYRPFQRLAKGLYRPFKLFFKLWFLLALLTYYG